MINRLGGCQCGEIHYVLSAPPLTLYVCHCRCQRQSSSGFGMSMPVPRDGSQIIQGEPKLWHRTAASGRVVACAFCKSCGTRIYHAPERNPAIVIIKPGTLDDSSDLVPVGHVWVSRAQPRLRPSITGLVFAEQPADFEPFFTAWAQRNRAPTS
jgi:hypothetical protein